MGYRDRLRPNITLTSPDGNVHTALWVGDKSSQSKKVGIFNYPDVKGSTTQDRNVRATMYPLSLSFVGDDNDLDAIAFMASLSEKGVWDVVHPVLGLLKLQPLEFSPNWQPVKSGNITQVDTEWIEPISPAAVASAPELQAIVSAQIDAVNEVAAEQLEQSVFQAAAEQIAAFRAAVLDGVAAVQENLQPIADFSASITAEIEAITRDINTVLAVVPLDIIAVAGQLQAMIQLPARAIQDVESRINTYKALADDISFSLTPDTPGTASYNRVAVQELCLTAVFCAVADISSTGVLVSRVEAIGIIQANLDLFNDATNALDASQTLFDGQSIDKQYFSQSQSYAVSAELNAQTVEYLLRSAFDLKTEKRFVLTAPANPARIAMQEYGGTGDGDANLILFNETNNIQGDEFLMMQAGREVVVYI